MLDGSFEATTASTTTVNGGSGWNAGDRCYIYNNSFGSGTTTFGAQWLDLSSLSSSDSQTISSGFILNQPYKLVVSCADVAGGTVPKMSLTVSGGATATQSFNVPQGSIRSGPLPFQTYELAFTPTTIAPITITLTNTGGYPMAFDNVTVVPEPAAWTMMFVGAMGVGLVARRRKLVVGLRAER